MGAFAVVHATEDLVGEVYADLPGAFVNTVIRVLRGRGGLTSAYRSCEFDVPLRTALEPEVGSAMTTAPLKVFAQSFAISNEEPV